MSHNKSILLTPGPNPPRCCTISFTVDTKFSTWQKFRSWIQFHSLPHDIFTIDYFTEKAFEMEALGADMITSRIWQDCSPPLSAGR